MTKQHKYFLFLMIALGGMWSACKQELSPCLTPTQVYMSARTVHRGSDTATIFSDTQFVNARFHPLTPSANTVFEFRTLTALFNLSLSPNDSFCRYAFQSDTTQTTLDTITVHYKAERQFLSNSCGYIYFYTLTNATTTHTLIDSVRINNQSVTNNVNTPDHLQIFVHPLF